VHALYVIQAEFERPGPGSKLLDAEMERAAASRGIALIDAGEWEQRDTWVRFPSSWIRQILGRFASGEVSLLEESAAPVATRRRKIKSDIKVGERKCFVNP
jgi:hypothetical protein